MKAVKASKSDDWSELLPTTTTQVPGVCALDLFAFFFLTVLKHIIRVTPRPQLEKGALYPGVIEVNSVFAIYGAACHTYGFRPLIIRLRGWMSLPELGVLCAKDA